MKRLLLSLPALALAAAPALAQDFDLDALIEAARAEPPINIYDSTGKITDMAKAFGEKYGLEATGTKSKAPAQMETIIREVQSGNVQTDVSLITDAPAVIAQLLPEGFAYSWTPPDLADDIMPMARDPLIINISPDVFAYNTALFDTCPITNIWQLTEPEWRGKLAMQDPLAKPAYPDWFNQMETHIDDQLAAAYEAQYGKPLETEYDTATKAFVAALAANGPLVTDSDSAAAEAAAAPGTTEPFIGLISVAKFRDNELKGFTLGTCHDVNPIIGFTTAKMGLIIQGTDSPNAAKLFIHYAMTEEGIEPQTVDGKISTNTTIHLPADEPSGVEAYLDQLLPYDPSSGLDDWDARQDWQGFWRLNYKR